MKPKSTYPTETTYIICKQKNTFATYLKYLIFLKQMISAVTGLLVVFSVLFLGRRKEDRKTDKNLGNKKSEKKFLSLFSYKELISCPENYINYDTFFSNGLNNLN